MPPSTKIEVANDLYNLDIQIGGKTYHNASITLYNITIGDVTFSSIPGGSTTKTVITSSHGLVDVVVGSIEMQSDEATITPNGSIDVMSVRITDGVINTVVFDTSATKIFSALGKIKAQ